MTIEERLKEYINSRYDSVTEFCMASGISSSTIFTVFKRGINSTSTKTILKICNALGLDVQALTQGEIKEIEHVEKDEEKGTDILQLIHDIEITDLTYKGEHLTRQQKRMIAYATKLALQMEMKNNDPE